MDVTQEQFNELVRQAVEKITASGEEPTPEAIQAAVEEVVAPLMKADEPVEEEKGADELMDVIVQALGNYVSVGAAPEPMDDEKACGTRRKADEVEPEEKAAPVVMEQKSAAPAPVERKYSNLFMSQAATNPYVPTSFKSRIEGMTDAKRAETVFGMFGRSVKCARLAGGDVEKAAWIAEKNYGDAEMASEFKALTATVPSDGGYTIPEVYSNEMIEMLRPMEVVGQLGCTHISMPNGNINIPKQTGTTSAYFIGETRPIKASQPEFGNLRLSAKKLASMTVLSNDLLRYSNFSSDVLVGKAMAKEMALGIDKGALYGSGGEFAPLGIYRNKGIRHIDVTALDAEYQNAGKVTELIFNYLASTVLAENVMGDSFGWLMNVRLEHYIKNMRDEGNRFLFAEEMNREGKICGYPYFVTNLIDTDKQGKTTLAFGNWSDMLVGEQGNVEIETFREGSYMDEAGNLHSPIVEDTTTIRAIDFVDVGLRHDESFVIAEKIAVPL